MSIIRTRIVSMSIVPNAAFVAGRLRLLTEACAAITGITSAGWRRFWECFSDTWSVYGLVGALLISAPRLFCGHR
jgi:hypothetical protein